MLLILLFPFIYLGIWAVVYRIPPSPSKLVDTRHAAAEKPYYLAFCSSLADNTFAGYPGHCYVVWATRYPLVFPQTESAGFVPRYFKDQIPSMFGPVPGLMVKDAWVGNQQNFTSFTAIVDQATFERTRRLKEQWNPDVFQVGVRDCVTLSNAIASQAGLKTPSPGFMYPQDYVRMLKQLN